MSDYDDLLFGRVAVRLGFTTEERLAECIRLQEEGRAAGYALNLGEVFQERGYLTGEQVGHVLARQRVARVREEDRLYGRIAVRNGLCDEAAVEAALMEQGKRRFAVRIGEILVRRKVLSEQQHRAVLQAQERVGRQREGRAVERLRAQYLTDPSAKTVVIGDDGGEVGEAEAKGVEKIRRDLIPGYEIEGSVGRGAMGIVYRARQLNLDRLVAIKVLLPAKARDQRFLKRFLREARTAALVNHPNVVRVFSVGEHRGLHFIAMEFVEGESAADRVHRDGPVPEEEALRIVEGVASGLAAAAARRIVHRDVKPENVMLTTRGAVKLCDLGLAKSSDPGLSPRLTQSGMTVGTPSYMSPEQIRGHRAVDTRSDLYALGGTFYFLLTGAPPFGADASPAGVVARHLTAPPPDPRAVQPAIGEGVAKMTMRLLAKDPDARPQDPAEVLGMIEAIRARPGRGGRPVIRRRRRRGVLRPRRKGRPR